MHVLTLTSLFPNSAQPLLGIFIRKRMENFTRRYGHDWTVVAPVPWFPRLPFKTSARYDTLARIPAYEEPWGFPIHHPRYLVTPKVGMRYYGTWMHRAVRGLVARIHRERPIDVLDCHYVFPDGTAGAELGKELGIPVILSARGTDLNQFPGFPAIRPLIQANLSGSRHLICVCSELARVGLELGMPPERISVIGNGIDPANFAPQDRAGARAALGLPAGKRILLSVGHLIERKGFHILIDAVARLRRDDLLLAIVGDGEMRDALKEQARRAGLAERVLFPGALQPKELPRWYAAADLFALCSSREGWPNVVCEAQAMGLPVVATKVWGVPEIIKDDSLGMLVEERAAQPLADALARALEKPWDLAHIRSAGQARTWDRVSEDLAPVFDAVLGREA